jgi:hypothetical protein
VSNKRKIYGKGRIEGAFTPLRHEVLNSPAWKHTSFGARLLYIALLRRLSFIAYNNGRVYLSTRNASQELGASQRIVCVWFRELVHYGFIVMTEPGSVGPKGRATRWRITDMSWGELDGKPLLATKDYLKWDGVLFERRCNPDVRPAKTKRLNREKKYSGRVPKVLTHDDLKYSPPLASEYQKYSEGKVEKREKKYSDLVQPSPISVAALAEGNIDGNPVSEIVGPDPLLADDWRRNSKSPSERLDGEEDDLRIPDFLRRTLI